LVSVTGEIFVKGVSMKNLKKLFGIIALVVVIGFLFVACDNGMQQNQGGYSSGGSGSFTTGTYYFFGYPSSLYITFNSNGRFTTDGSTSGTYSVSGTRITLSSSYYGRNWTVRNSTTVVDGEGDWWQKR
jgi:hypothetical protein